MKVLWDNLFRKNSSQSKIYTLLKETILFADLEDNELSILEKIMNPRKFHAGETVFRQGDGGVGMYLIISGSVNIFLDQVLEDQEVRQSLITRLFTGDFFGESALVIESGKRSATIVAREDCELLHHVSAILRRDQVRQWQSQRFGDPSHTTAQDSGRFEENTLRTEGRGTECGEKDDRYNEWLFHDGQLDELRSLRNAAQGQRCERISGL